MKSSAGSRCKGKRKRSSPLKDKSEVIQNRQYLEESMQDSSKDSSMSPRKAHMR